MKGLQKIILLFGLCVLIVNCGSKKVVTKKSKKDNKEKVVISSKETQTASEVEEVPEQKNSKKATEGMSTTEAYIYNLSDIAQDEMRKYGIPASITLAQGILESGSGKGRLSVKANNHFGIKCHDWKGAKIYHDDDRSQECFRKYRKAETSYEDHSEFLTGRKRYASLFRLKPNDYKGWAKGLRAAGYATDRKYPQKLVSLIERYKLYEYDEEVLGGKPKKTSVIEKDSKVKHVVVKGDTLYSISRLYRTTVEAIKENNNLTSNDLSIGQELIISN